MEKKKQTEIKEETKNPLQDLYDQLDKACRGYKANEACQVLDELKRNISQNATIQTILMRLNMAMGATVKKVPTNKAGSRRQGTKA